MNGLTKQEQIAVYRAIYERRNICRFLPDGVVQWCAIMIRFFEESAK
jgi:hypothetical protein